jgi:hypothetical protein
MGTNCGDDDDDEEVDDDDDDDGENEGDDDGNSEGMEAHCWQLQLTSPLASMVRLSLPWGCCLGRPAPMKGMA